MWTPTPANPSASAAAAIQAGRRWPRTRRARSVASSSHGSQTELRTMLSCWRCPTMKLPYANASAPMSAPRAFAPSVRA
jgi:hypothetical protein